MTPNKPFSITIWGEDKVVVANASFITDRDGLLEILTTAENVGTQVDHDAMNLPTASGLLGLYKTAERYRTLIKLMGHAQDGSQTSVHIHTDEAAADAERVQLSVGKRLIVGRDLAACLDLAEATTE